jgi:hypothetical protein
MSPSTWIFIMAAGVLLSALGLGLVRRVCPYDSMEQHNHPLGYAHGVVGVLYAVLVAFVIVATWEQHEQATDAVNEEMRALSDVANYARLIRDELHPDPKSPDGQVIDTLASYLRRYANDMFWEGIPNLQTCSQSPNVEEDARAVLEQLEMTAPLVKTRAMLYLAFSKGDEANVRRENSEISCAKKLPPPLWAVLIIGGITTVGMTWFYGVKSRQIHYLITAATSLIVMCSILLAAHFAHPFSGIEVTDTTWTFSKPLFDELPAPATIKPIRTPEGGLP